MAATETYAIPLGFKAPEFTLPDTVDDKEKSLSELRGSKATVIMFICNHCPYVIHINDALIRLAKDYMPEGVAFIAISSNDIENYPQDAPEKMKETAYRLGYPFPYLYDATQEVAKAYHAACTPDISIFDEDMRCVYRGQLDDSRPKNDIPVSGRDVRSALDALLAGKSVSPIQKVSLGCNIKWKISQ